MSTTKESVINWIDNLNTEVTFTDELKDSISDEVNLIADARDRNIQYKVLDVLINMAVNDELPLDMTTLDIEEVFNKALDK